MIARHPLLTPILAGLAAFGLIGVVAFLLLAPGQVQGGSAEARIGGVRLKYGRDYARFSAGREGGEIARLDLAAYFPGFAPAGVVTNLLSPAEVNARMERTLFLTLRRTDSALDPAERPVKLYTRFLENEPLPAPRGLQHRRFVPGSPYERNDLFLAPPEGRAFYALCPQPEEKPDGVPETCIHTYRSRGLDVEMRFSSSRLADWEALIAGTRDFVDRMRSN